MACQRFWENIIILIFNNKAKVYEHINKAIVVNQKDSIKNVLQLSDKHDFPSKTAEFSLKTINNCFLEAFWKVQPIVQ